MKQAFRCVRRLMLAPAVVPALSFAQADFPTKPTSSWTEQAP
jgi:hypothetical protein